MNFKSLIHETDVREFSAADIVLPSIPADGNRLLRDVARRFPFQCAAYVRRHSFDESLEISSYPNASGPWYADRRIRFLIWMGDLTIDADLIDDDFQTMPLLIVRGNLSVRNWLRGGMASFVGGNVRASEFIVGHYNDSALFVGGDVTANGYVRRAKPYPDLPDMAPHQVAGKIDARQFSVIGASEQQLRAAFVDDVLSQDDEGTWLDESAIIERSSAGLAVWR